MTRNNRSQRFPGGTPPRAKELSCEECRAGLPDFVRGALSGLKPMPEGIPGHLESCATCSWAYLDLFDLMTATTVKQLMDSWTEPKAAPPKATLEGLLRLLCMLLGAAELAGDLKTAARSLSLIGLTHRELQDAEEARLVHDLALQTAEDSGDLLSKAISYTDLGWIALSESENEVGRAIGHFEKAYENAACLTDGESSARILVLWGDALGKQGKKNQALEKYGAAAKEATDASYQTGLEVARQRALPVLQDRLAGLIAACSPIWGEHSALVRSLKQSLPQIPGAASLRPPLYLFYATSLQELAAAAAAGEKILVVNTGAEIPARKVGGPRVNRDGNVILSVSLDEAAMGGLPSVFLIDLLFLPSNEVLKTVRVGKKERSHLQSDDGLDIQAALPHFDAFREQLRYQLLARNLRFLNLARTAFALRIWWEASDFGEVATSYGGKQV